MTAHTRYDIVAYPSKAYAHAHPDRLHAMGRIFGMNPASVASARILELGCGAGGHLLPMACHLPEATFVGMDASHIAIAQAQEHAKALGLTNITFQHADLNTWTSDASYDYIVCHGVYSWVPDEARAHILNHCRRLLSPEGIAYISYNALPGWHLHKVGREILRWHGEQFRDPAEQVEQGKALLGFFAEHLKDNPAGYAQVMQHQAAMMRGFSDAYVFHDFLSPENTPFRLVDVVQQAENHELQYLGDAELGQMLPEGLPDALHATLDRIAPDLVRLEQYLDLLRGTSFRRSLFCHADRTLTRALTTESLSGLRLECGGQSCDEQVDLAQPTPRAFATGDGTELTVQDGGAQAALLYLISCYPMSAPTDLIMSTAQQWLGDTPLHRQRVGGALIRAHAAGLVDLVGRARVTLDRVPERPRVSTWVRYAVDQGAEQAANLRHEVVPLDRFERVLVRHCDGSRTLEQLIERVEAAVLSGELELTVDGTATSEPEIIRSGVAALVPRKLERLRRRAILVDASRN
ncbi:MAG: methyltransferase regulatory domain-containing protein [Myxococcota bacterium]